MVRRITKYSFIFVLFAFVYLILRESISPVLFALGLFFAVFSVLVANRFLLDDRYVDAFNFNVLKFIIYFFYLLFRIILSRSKNRISDGRRQCQTHDAELSKRA